MNRKPDQSLIDFYFENQDYYDLDKEIPHSYISCIYSKFMSKMVNINLLEIGVWKGNSIKFWADCFPDGNITGIDNYLEYDQSVLEIPQKGKNYKILIKDAYDLKFVKSIRKKFDVIIDDGPHTWESQEFSLINYYKLLKPGGILIIEDIPSLDAAHGLIGRYDHCQLFDLREEKHRWDDIAIIRTRQ